MMAAALSDITDGTGTTIMCVETIEQHYARWAIGTEVTLATLPQTGDNRLQRRKVYAVPEPGADTTFYYSPASRPSATRRRAL